LDAGATLVFLWVIAWMIHQRGKRQAEPAATVIAGNLAKARRLHDGSLDQAELRYRQEQERITKEFENTNRTLNQQWKQTLKEGYDTRGIRGKKVDEKGARALLANELTTAPNSNRLNAITRTTSSACGRKRTHRPHSSRMLTRRKWRN
jgi:F0F1-type ATP synthase membrane subunit b/b'